MYIHKNWKVYSVENTDQQWNVDVPGSLFASLYNQDIIDDWNYGIKENEALSLADDDYIYFTEFECDCEFESALKTGKKIFINFDGIDTLAEIFLNGKSLGKTENMHRRYSFPVNGLIKYDSANLLEVKIFS